MVSGQTLSLSSFDLQFRGRNRLIQVKTKKNTVRISCCSSDHSHSDVTMDPYEVLGIRPGSSKSRVKRAFRKLAKKYHPDVCKGKNSSVQFEEINAAYEVVMSYLRGESSSAYGRYYDEDYNNEGYSNEHKKGRTDQRWDYGDEWIGWEVGNWIFYQQHQQEETTEDLTSFEETDQESRQLSNKSCYSQVTDNASDDNTLENVSN
ncbi:chaperone protein dnaJ 8, chloroplastic-like [Neltuma alba]|uniref:chaperone protein dnaJ 8, chloroplastic-like n=1 Tax=Neltuma alba TaxID=207710 RepID=UPI0010A51A16|nr:chaperone protein dnaJ 8, chloroplastic-like [Prosopis alba]